MVNVYKLWYEVKLTDKIKFQEMVFPEGVLYDYSTFGTTKTAHIYTLKQLIDTPNSTMVLSAGIEPASPPSEGGVLSVERRGPNHALIYIRASLGK